MAFRDPRPIVDAKDQIIAIMAGQPSDPTYGSSCMDAFDEIMLEGQAARFHKSSKHHPGPFPVVSVGISYGKGQKVPSHLQNGMLAAIVNWLVGSKAVIRMATYASTSYNLWAPRLHRYYEEPNFSQSVFPCTAFNFGGSVSTFKHCDILNCPYGLCTITALGGHIILWELKVFIQFPHAATIFIPSATITHSNIPPAEGNSHISFTQFFAGGILHWVDNGFWTEKELANVDPAAYVEMVAHKATCWKMGLGLLSQLDEILEPT
ncbi:hypothetical protein EDD85DRAFT_923151 [Armillaria nabsnona]|nr:hypothetical protein EDD85DRAFT_923151 [Armillaria nabsnona]